MSRKHKGDWLTGEWRDTLATSPDIRDPYEMMEVGFLASVPPVQEYQEVSDQIRSLIRRHPLTNALGAMGLTFEWQQLARETAERRGGQHG